MVAHRADAADQMTAMIQTSVQDRLLGALGAAIVVTLLGYGLLVGMAVEIHAQIEQAMALLDLRAPLPKPPLPPPPVERPKHRRASGPASPRNLKNKATEIVTPPPLILPPIPPPVVSAQKAGTGMAASTGAADRPGPGEGAGGQGNGTGGGGDGDDDGDVPPRRIRGQLKSSDLPPDLRDSEFSGTVAVRYDVETDGTVGICEIMGSSGSAELDRLTCRLIQQRFRFDPSRDSEGRPVESTIEENHRWEIDLNRDPHP